MPTTSMRLSTTSSLPSSRQSTSARVATRHVMPALVRSFGGKRPQLGANVFLAETCAVVGDVTLGDDSSIWYGVTIRADAMPVRIGARTNIQDNSVIHITSDA